MSPSDPPGYKSTWTRNTIFDSNAGDIKEKLNEVYKKTEPTSKSQEIQNEYICDSKEETIENSNEKTRRMTRFYDKNFIGSAKELMLKMGSGKMYNFMAPFHVGDNKFEKYIEALSEKSCFLITEALKKEDNSDEDCIFELIDNPLHEGFFNFMQTKDETF